MMPCHTGVAVTRASRALACLARRACHLKEVSQLAGEGTHVGLVGRGAQLRQQGRSPERVGALRHASGARTGGRKEAYDTRVPNKAPGCASAPRYQTRKPGCGPQLSFHDRHLGGCAHQDTIFGSLVLTSFLATQTLRTHADRGGRAGRPKTGRGRGRNSKRQGQGDANE